MLGPLGGILRTKDELGIVMQRQVNANQSAKQGAAARRTVWILGIIAAAMFVLSIVQQLVLMHHL